MYTFTTVGAAPESIPELEPFDEEELDDIFAYLEAGEGETDDE